ncbi:MAG: hypothetical protein QW604_03345 [Fervidicoccaceae archaeon]
MKKESRVLFLFSKNNFVVGFLLRKSAFEKVYIGCSGQDFINRIQNDSAFKQTRKVYYLQGSDLPAEFKILNASQLNNAELSNLAYDIIQSLKKLSGEDTCISAQNVEA